MNDAKLSVLELNYYAAPEDGDEAEWKAEQRYYDRCVCGEGRLIGDHSECDAEEEE